MRDPEASGSLEVGACLACGQELLRTAEDCWHPWYVVTACPPERKEGALPLIDWGDGYGRPGRDKFRTVTEPLRDES